MSEIIDTYRTIQDSSIGEYKEKGSKFIAYAYEIENEVQFKEYLEQIKKEHFKARHHCFAYKIGLNEDNFRYNDDGEPGGTAGLPIFNQIKSYNLTNVAVIVVRYFGGTKLGVSGLIQAYKTATIEAFENTVIIEKHIENNIEIEYDFNHIGDIMKVINSMEITIIDNIYEITPKIIVKTRKSMVDVFIIKLYATILNRNIDDITLEEKIDGWTIKIIENV
ncbi:MAG: YigZ family protein [Saprospiraceae bacterium]